MQECHLTPASAILPSAGNILTYGRNNEIQLPIINSNIDVGFQQVIYDVYCMFHEVFGHLHENLLSLAWRIGG